ncbi:MAG: glycosyltransferase [Coleofasciculaceae cyanobacterium]
MSKDRPHLTFYTYQLFGGGAERVIVNLMQDFVQRGLKIDLVLNAAAGPYLHQVPSEVRIVELKARLPFRDGIPKLVHYLRKERPPIMLATVHPYTEIALLAKIFAFSSTRIFVREENMLSLNAPMARDRSRWSPFFAKLLYPWVADGIIAISQGVAEDIMQITGMDRKRIQVIYNPALTPHVREKSKEPLNHPWFKYGEPPIILGVGRLEPQKDFDTLIRAFALVRQVYPCRLVILGKGIEEQKLKDLTIEIGLEHDVAMLGFVENPYIYMAKSAVFVLSSAWEGFGNVIAEALALGTPVVSTNCLSGPAEILDNGKYGQLVPVGDTKEMAEAILRVLSGNSKSVDADWLEQFTLQTVALKYLNVLGVSEF